MSDVRSGRWPSSTEKLVRWNVPSRGGRQLWMDLNHEKVSSDPFDYITSIEGTPPEIFETESVKQSLVDAYDAFFDRFGYPRINDLMDDLSWISVWHRGETVGCIDPIDRTVELPVSDPDMLVAGLVIHIQEVVLSIWPLWRIEAIGNPAQGEQSLMIYPKVVRVGELQCPPMDLDLSLRTWSAAIKTIRDVDDGPTRRQLKHIRPLILKGISELQPDGIVYVAAFDNLQGDFTNVSVWVIAQENADILACAPASLGKGPRYGIAEDGRLVEWGAEESSYSLIVWTMSREEIGGLVIEMRGTKQKFPCTFGPHDVVRDEVLQAGIAG